MTEKKFESGISDYVVYPVTVEITFPIDRNGNPVFACEYCRMYTGRRCVLTDEVIFEAQKYVGFKCPLKER